MPQLEKEEVLERCVNTLEEHIQNTANTYKAMGLMDKSTEVSNAWFAIKAELKGTLEDQPRKVGKTFIKEGLKEAEGLFVVGKPINELSKEELKACIGNLNKQMKAQARSHVQDLEILGGK